MKPKEFKAIAKAMRECGVSHFKCGDTEIQMAQELPVERKNKRIKQSAPISPTTPPEHSDPIEHKVEALASLMKLSDSDLVDELFPDHTADQESA